MNPDIINSDPDSPPPRRPHSQILPLILGLSALGMPDYEAARRVEMPPPSRGLHASIMRQEANENAQRRRRKGRRP